VIDPIWLAPLDIDTIAAAANDRVEGRSTGWLPAELPGSGEITFRGPF
jgi:hypothetical protein